MFSNGKNMTNCQFLHHDDSDAEALAIPQVFSENSPSKNHNSSIPFSKYLRVF